MSELIDLLYAFGVRETIVALVVLVAVYMLVVVLRMKSLSVPRKADTLSSARYEADLSRKDNLDRFYVAPDRLDAAGTQVRATVPVEAQEPRRESLWRGESAQVTSIDQEKINRLDRELSSTRDELDALRMAFAEVRDELRQEIDRLKASQRVSPMYADSMQMAISGASADEITSRCGISRAEADLVQALAQGRAGGKVSQDRESEPGSGGGQTRYGSY